MLGESNIVESFSIEQVLLLFLPKSGGKGWGAIAPPAPMALLQTATKALKRRNRNKKNKQLIQIEQTQQAIPNDA